MGRLAMLQKCCRISTGIQVPIVCMVRNMEPLTRCFHRTSLKGLIRNIVRRHAARYAVDHSDGVIAVSEYVRDFLKRQWRVRANKVQVIYHGVDSGSTKPTQKPSWWNDSLHPFLFSAGSLVPYRGFEDIIQAAADPQFASMEIKFILAGDENNDSDGYGRYLRTLILNARLSNRVLMVGKLSSAEMAWCYRETKAFIATSRVEACPNTALEALAFGCNLVSNDCPPYPEFFKRAALYYNPKRGPSLAVQISRTLMQPSKEVNERKEAALTLADSFTWRRTASRTLEFLQQTLTHLQGIYPKTQYLK